MTAAPDIVERLRDSGRTDWNGLVHTAREAATEIERLRVACAGALSAAERIAQNNVKLRERLDATRRRTSDVATIATKALALAAEINVELLQARISGR